MYVPHQHSLIDRLLRESNVLIAYNDDEKVVCGDKEQDQLYGWVCSQRWCGIDVFHYAYVKKPFRGFGLGKMLIGDKLDHMAHVTHWVERFARKKEYLIFNPYPLYKGDDRDQGSETQPVRQRSA